jgi:hypothetical protein
MNIIQPAHMNHALWPMFRWIRSFWSYFSAHNVSVSKTEYRNNVARGSQQSENRWRLDRPQALGAIVAGEDREWHFLMMIPRSSRVTVQYN